MFRNIQSSAYCLRDTHRKHVMYNVRNIIEHSTDNCSTVSICSLDLSKAFDKMNHYALFIKLMEKKLSNEIWNILEQWFVHYTSYLREVEWPCLFLIFQAIGR